jgi:arylformamidase
MTAANKSRIIDLTMPVSDHFRWKVDRQLKEAHERGDQFQITWLGWSVHGFTHVDAPRHMVPGGATTSDFRLEQLTGEAAVVDLVDVKEGEQIDAQRLANRAGHVEAGDIVLLKTCWEERFPVDTPEFWTRAPWLTRDACDWLRKRRIKALGVDFPQDEPIRYLLGGVVKPISEYVSHDVLLREGILLIEYLCNLGELKKPRTHVFVLPLKVMDADGAPVRAIAVEP